MKTSSKRKRVKKHVAAVHSSGELTLIQRKICNALLYKAFPNLQHTEVHEISIRELIDLIGFSGNNHAVLKKSFRALLSAVFEWNLLREQGDEEWTASTLLASARISGSRCFYSYSAHLRELFYMPTVYASIDILTQSKFKSIYGLALYENCVRYKNIRHTKWLPINVFRSLMGIPDDKYPIFRDLKRRVIDVAVHEINIYSDIKVEPEYEKHGRAVAKIRFLIKENNLCLQDQREIDFDNESGPEYNEELATKLVSFIGLSRESAIKLCNQYTEEQLLEKIEFICESDSFKKGDIKNLSAYFIAALKNDFKTAKSSSALLAEQQMAIRQIEEQNAQVKKQHLAKNRDYEEYTSQFLLNRLSTEDISAVQDSFKDHLMGKDFCMRDMYDKKGLDSPMVWATFKSFLSIECPHFYEGMKTFDEFFSSQAITEE